MNPSKEVLDKKLSAIETLRDVSEHDIESELRKLRDANAEEDPCNEWVYEILAFSFCENYEDKQTGWGTYFGPMMVWQANDGKTNESPSIQLVNKEVITYWNHRFQETGNPIMQARYAGLVWDLSVKAIEQKPHYSVALIYCQALLKIAQEKIHKYDVDVIQKLERALLIATSLNKQELITRAKKTILDYERLVAEDSKPGLWGFSFDLLIGNRRISLSEEEEREIIETLEARLVRLNDLKDSEPWICENAAERLARYYRSKGLEEECSRVIKTLGRAFELAATKVAPLTASSLLEHMYRIYIQFNHLDDAERITTTIRELGPRVRDNMKMISHEMEISSDEFKAYVESIVDGELDQILAGIAIHYIPRREEIKKQLYKLAKQAPISFLFTNQITDNRGRVVATIGSLEEDLDGHIVTQMSQNMSVSVIFLDAVLEQTIKKFNLDSDKLANYLLQSPVFIPHQKDFLIKGIQKYIEQDYIIAIHLLIPQIEATVRNLVEIFGGAVLKSGRGGGFHLRTLDEILRSEQVMRSLGEDVALYFRVVLTDQRGWNVRNDVCHGISLPNQFSKGVVDRLIHILLLLAQLRSKEV